MGKTIFSRIAALLMSVIMMLSVFLVNSEISAKAAGTVTFKNGNETIDTVAAGANNMVAPIAAPEQDGLLFAGWFTSNVGVISDVASAKNSAFNFSTAINSDRTLYAGWINVGTGANSHFYLQGVQYRAVNANYTAGIRFITRIDDAIVSNLMMLNAANSDLRPKSSSQKGIGYGTVLTYADRLAYGDMLVKDVDATSIARGNVVVPAVKTYAQGSNYRTYTALVVNIPSNYYSQHIAARPYITYADANGNTQTYYYTETSGTTHKLGGAYYINYNEAVKNSTDDDAIALHENPGYLPDGELPQIRTDITPNAERMYFQLNNKTNGAFSDSQIYWAIIGRNASGNFCCVDSNGNLIPLTTSMNTIQMPDRMCANICHTLAEKDYIYVPDIVSGRMYLSYGSPVYITVNVDAAGNIGYAGPDLNNASDPNQNVYFEFIEFTIKNKEYWGNTTRVDFFSFPIVTRLIGEGGFCNYPGDADVYDKTVGDIGTREQIFAAYRSEVTNEFASLVDDMRIMAPCKATFNEGKQYGSYYDAYINQFWNKYASETLVFSCDAGTFRGHTTGDAMIFTKDGDNNTYTIYKPTTQHVLEGKGNFDRGNSTELVIEAQMCAAFNRGVAMQPEKWADNTAYYQTAPSNSYSGFFHRHSYGGLAYGFCYDDVFDNSTLLHYTNPTGLIIDLKW